MACRLAADSVIPPCLACSWTHGPGRQTGCWGNLGDPLSGTQLQLSSRATETALHRSCGPEAWSRCMPSIESIGRAGARSGNEQDRLVSIPWTQLPGEPVSHGVSTLTEETNGEPGRFPQRQNLARLVAAVGILKRRREIHGRPNLGFPKDKQEKKGRPIWGTTEWSNRPPSLFAAPHDAMIETLLFPRSPAAAAHLGPFGHYLLGLL